MEAGTTSIGPELVSTGVPPLRSPAVDAGKTVSAGRDILTGLWPRRSGPWRPGTPRIDPSCHAHPIVPVWSPTVEAGKTDYLDLLFLALDAPRWGPALGREHA